MSSDSFNLSILDATKRTVVVRVSRVDILRFIKHDTCYSQRERIIRANVLQMCICTLEEDEGLNINITSTWI